MSAFTLLRGAIAASVLSAIAFGASAAGVTVTTGAGYIKMIDALTAQYTAKTGKTVEKSLGGNIGQMLTQVKQGNAVNVVISDDATLKKFGDILSPEAQKLGTTPLVLIWKKGIELSAPEEIAGDKVKSLGSPDPKAAIYGRSAKSWLAATGLGKKVEDKLNIGSTVPQIFSYVATGNMDAGFVNLTAWRAGKDKVGGHFEITDPSAQITMVVRTVKGSENDPDVKDFIAFLTSEAAKPALEKFGVR